MDTNQYLSVYKWTVIHDDIKTSSSSDINITRLDAFIGYLGTYKRENNNDTPDIYYDYFETDVKTILDNQTSFCKITQHLYHSQKLCNAIDHFYSQIF